MTDMRSTPTANSKADHVDASGTPGSGTAERSAADRFMRRLLRLPEQPDTTPDAARKAFQTSLVITACRCLVMYLVVPFVLPAVGLAQGVGPAVGLVIGLAAICAIVYSIRRFWRADHSKRWHYTVFGLAIMVGLAILAVQDTLELLR